MHRKHCALDASSDANASCNVDDAGMASGWLPSAAMVEEAKESSSSLWYIDGSMLDGLPLLASVRGKAKESDGRTKRQARRSRSLARARERCSVSQRERREDTQSVLVENLCVTAKLPSSLHEQTRGCRSGVGPGTTLRAAHQPGWAAAHPRAGRNPPRPGAPQHKHKHKHKVSSQQASARSRSRGRARQTSSNFRVPARSARARSLVRVRVGT